MDNVVDNVGPYPVETLDEYSDDGTMVESLKDLTEAVVGHKIVRVERKKIVRATGYYDYGADATVITLDNGKEVILNENGDCCAYTEVTNFLLNPTKVDHVITGVGTTDGFDRWHIFADMGDVVGLQVGWSCGNPFYYSYGFDIEVRDVSEMVDVEAKKKELEG